MSFLIVKFQYFLLGTLFFKNLSLKTARQIANFFFRARKRVLLCVPNMTHRQHAEGTRARLSRARAVKNMGTPTTSTRAPSST